MNDRERIIDAINELFLAVDRRDWDAARRLLAPEVQFAMTSAGRGETAMRAREDIVGSWEHGLRQIQAIHHQAGNYRVRLKGDVGDAFCYATAYHLLPEGSPTRVRTFVGSYEYTLRRRAEDWEITGFRFDCKFIDPPL